VRTSSSLSLFFGVVGWLPLLFSVFAALAESGRSVIAVSLGIAGLCGIMGLAFAINAFVRDRSAFGGLLFGLGAVLSIALLLAGTYWGLAEFAR
jgi:low temperature requirement protein LtrA